MAQAETNRWEKKWVYVPMNLYVDANMPKLDNLLRRASKAGYNGVLFTDYKMCTWWKLEAAERWKRNAGKLRALTTELGMELTVCVFPFGRSGSLLYHDVNLATGMPVRDAPMMATNGILVPVPTVTLNNGSFEEYSDNTAKRYSFQDDPGTGSFIDTNVVKHGRASLRFEDVGKANENGHGRICQAMKVESFHQYRIRAWMKTENLTADELKLLVLASGRTLQWQNLSALVNGNPQVVGQSQNLTTDWIEQSVTFNSLDNSNVNVYAGLWGGKTGKIWWDDLRIDDVPALNVLRRDSLPLSVKAEDGTIYTEGKDFETICDKDMGMKPWPGDYNTSHEPPVIRLAPGSRISEGQKVLLDCYHASIVYDQEIACSLSDPKVFDICRTQMQKTREALNPDGYFMSHDEIRNGGWEPAETDRFRTCGELFAFNISNCYRIARESVAADVPIREARMGASLHPSGYAGQACVAISTSAPIYVWSDMYDPTHNAHDNFYLVRNNIAGSWEGLDRNIVIMKWSRNAEGLKFFADRGHKQMIAAFYDGDVESDHVRWTEAMKNIPNIEGVMYTTWNNDYSKLEDFAKTWWSGEVTE